METPNEEIFQDETVMPPSAVEATDKLDPLTSLQAEVDAARAKAAENLDGWQRERANFTNYKKRIEREQAEASQNASATVLARFLPVIDDFELALKNMPANDEAAKWAQGVALVQRKFISFLENEGIKRIEAEGQYFDPNFHEAVVHEESDKPENQIIEVLRHGYKLGERVLRPALVKVSKGK
jgi:molecular chaperone GrpE